MMPMNIIAKIIFNLPHNNKSGAIINSIIFISPIITICIIAFILDLNLVKIQRAIIFSKNPIKIVKGLEKSFPKILATICSCLGVRFNTLQKRPFASQTIEIKYINILCFFSSVTICMIADYVYSNIGNNKCHYTTAL